MGGNSVVSAAIAAAILPLLHPFVARLLPLDLLAKLAEPIGVQSRRDVKCPRRVGGL